MKLSLSIIQTRSTWPYSWSTMTNNYQILYGLMVPFCMVILNMTMFTVALPTIRDTFALSADVVAWLITAHSLPFMMGMPLYGRLGDQLGKRNVFFAGIAIFAVGTVIAFSATGLTWLILGRAIQGLGASCVSPLSLAILSQNFSAAERGKALGTWNSMGPISGIMGPFMGGFLIEYISWRTIFGPISLAAVATILMVILLIAPQDDPADWTALLRFDWLGVGLLGATVTTIAFYLSSETITGVAPLQDWRLLVLLLPLVTAFVHWERRRLNPYVDLQIFSNITFTRAATCSGIRMFILSGFSFLIPLYLTDIYALSADYLGMVMMLHAGGILLLMRLGGQLADQWSSRVVITSGFVGQTLVLIGFALLPETAPLWLAVLLIGLHGVAVGGSLAAIHRAALGAVPDETVGSAAGIYGLVRFSGILFGPVSCGMLLQQGLNYGLPTITAYQVTGWLIVVAALIAALVARGVRA